MKFLLKLNKFLFISIFAVTGILGDAFAQGRRNPSRSDFPQGTKFIALTFDDGPTTNETVKILDELKRLDPNAKVTFYVNGAMFNDQTVPILQRMIAEGHDVCNHGFYHYSHGTSHPDSKDAAGNSVHLDTYEKARENIQRNSEAIFEATGFWPFSFRAPFFEFGTWLMGMDVTLNMPFVQARHDTNDWMQSNQDNPHGMANRLIAEAKDGLIVLMHDAPAGRRQGTVDALAFFIPQLISQGYAFVTVRELFMINEAQPERFQGPFNTFNPNGGLPLDINSASGKRWNHEDFWPDNLNNWWLQDWWACPTPPWDRNLSDVCSVVLPRCPVCNNINCSCSQGNVCNICQNNPCTCDPTCEPCVTCNECECDCNNDTRILAANSNRRAENFTVTGITGAGRLNLSVPVADNYTVSLYSIDGRQLAQTTTNLTSGANSLSFNRNLAGGITIVKIQGANNAQFVKRIMVR